MTTDTSYNAGYAPFAAWAARQAPVPATTHNLPSTVAANGSVTTSLIVTEGFSLISAGVTSTQAGTLTIQRYLDAGGTVLQGAASSVSLTANAAANLDVLDGKPFASFRLTVTNNGSSVATLSSFALLLQASAAGGSSSGGGGSGGAITASDGAITTIGTTTDTAYASGSGTLVALLKGLFGKLAGTLSVALSGITTAAGAAGRVVVSDPSTGNGALVQAFHNADNQSLGSTSYGVMTGGVDQLVNGSGNLDRKRGVSGDGMAVTGLAAEVPMLWNGASYDRLPGSAAIGAKIAQLPVVVTSSAFSRPANTTAYSFGYLVANSTTAGSVTPITIAAAKAVNIPGVILRCRLLKSGTSVTSAIFRVHLYSAAPTVTNGDGAAWLSNQSANYIGSMDVTIDKAMSDGAIGIGYPTIGAGLNFIPAAGTQNIYALIEARAAYTPASAESFTLSLEVQ